MHSPSPSKKKKQEDEKLQTVQDRHKQSEEKYLQQLEVKKGKDLERYNQAIDLKIKHFNALLKRLEERREQVDEKRGNLIEKRLTEEQREEERLQEIAQRLENKFKDISQKEEMRRQLIKHKSLEFQHKIAQHQEHKSVIDETVDKAHLKKVLSKSERFDENINDVLRKRSTDIQKKIEGYKQQVQALRQNREREEQQFEKKIEKK